MNNGTSFGEALAAYRPDATMETLSALVDPDALLAAYHPDFFSEAAGHLVIGANAGESCQRELMNLLQAEAIIDEADLAGTPVTESDVLVIGGGGAACAAALAAAGRGARVVMAAKLRLGDSNTVMAEGGIQAAIEPDDTAERHVQDTLRGGHEAGDPALVAAMADDAPEVIRWLIRQGMQFDQTDSGDLATRRAGGMSAARIVHCRDYTGLEMMRVLREAVIQHRGIEVREQSPVVELLSNEVGERCVGAVIRSLTDGRYAMVRARAVILATGGLGRLHLNGFPTSNHLGATGDGLVLAYRIGARLREIDSFQYHPTGLVNPAHLSGKIVTEGVRAAGALLINGKGQRFIDELLPRDVVCAAILRECREGRGIHTEDNAREGVWLDTPRLEQAQPGLLASQFPKLLARTRVSGIDPRVTPLLVHPTLHYQNGGVVVDSQGATTVPGLFAAGEVTGGLHGRNRIMGNALLEIISFGRRAGAAAAACHDRGPKKVTLEHINRMRRAITLAGLSSEQRAPRILPPYATKGLWALL